MARKPETTWNMLNEALAHFTKYIDKKKQPHELSIIDLLYVSNFKGGNASITEPPSTLQDKLNHYSLALKEIKDTFNKKTLSTLDPTELNDFSTACTAFIKLTQESSSKIRGLGPSYASALLSAHLIDLAPILDRRVLNGANISTVKMASGQVKDIESHYRELIEAFHKELKKTPGLTIRELDRRWFIEPV